MGVSGDPPIEGDRGRTVVHFFSLISGAENLQRPFLVPCGWQG